MASHHPSQAISPPGCKQCNWQIWFYWPRHGRCGCWLAYLAWSYVINHGQLIMYTEVTCFFGPEFGIWFLDINPILACSDARSGQQQFCVLLSSQSMGQYWRPTSHRFQAWTLFYWALTLSPHADFGQIQEHSKWEAMLMSKGRGGIKDPGRSGRQMMWAQSLQSSIWWACTLNPLMWHCSCPYVSTCIGLAHVPST